MNKLRLIAFTSAGLLVSTGALLVACSDDTSVEPSVDGGGTETSTPPDGGTPDGGGGEDAKPDAFDAGFVVQTFPSDLGEALCGSLARCCFGNANLPEAGAVDGGTFDRPSCESFYAQFGFEGSNLGHSLLDGGNIELDQAKAADCVAKVKALTCDLSAADFQAARDACFGALRGKLNAGACKGNIECAQGFYCKTALGSDSGVGTCTAIQAVGGNCGDFTEDPGAADPACSWRGSGDTKRFCQFDDDNDPTALRAPADWKCAEGLTNGSGCYLSTWCKDGICDEATGNCKTPSNYFGNSCAKYVVP
jgi:hypothetical protein